LTCANEKQLQQLIYWSKIEDVRASHAGREAASHESLLITVALKLYAQWKEMYQSFLPIRALSPAGGFFAKA